MRRLGLIWGLAAAAVACGQPVTTQRTPSGAAATATPRPAVTPSAPVPTPVISLGGWVVVGIPGDVSVTAMVGGDPGLMAGSDSRLFDSGGAPVWRTDASGALADVARLPIVDPSIAAAYPYTGVALGDRVVLFGRGEGTRCAKPDAAVIWVGSGEAWSAKPFEEADCTRIPASVTAGPAGILMATFSSGDVAGLWASSDGRAWRPVSLPADGASGAVAFGAGRYFVAGRTEPISPEGANPTVVASSADLAAWEVTEIPADAEQIAGAAGAALAWSPVARRLFRTLDGARWEEVAASAVPAGATALSATGGAFAFTGGERDLNNDAPTNPKLWLSVDGLAWTPVPLPDGVFREIGTVARLGTLLAVHGIGAQGGDALALRDWPPLEAK